jgi:hypothetical protein
VVAKVFYLAGKPAYQQNGRAEPKGFHGSYSKTRNWRLEMELKDQVGLTAGKIWEELSQGGPQTLTQLKKKVNGQSDLVNFAVGWLAREDKVSILADKKNIRVELR